MAERRKRPTWQLHESTARGLCQLAFVLLGVLPLGCCLVFSAQQFLPTYQRQQATCWEQWLSSQLGVKVRVAAYESRAPGRFALHEIRLLHPETGALIGRARVAEAQRSQGKWAIRLTQPELEANELATAWRIAHDWFLCRPQTSSLAARIGASQLTIQSARQPQVLHDITLTILPTADATLLSFQFQPQPGAVASSTVSPQATQSSGQPKGPQPAQWIVKRHHQQSGLKTEMQLRSGTAPLPCGLLAQAIPWLDKLGVQATFAGNLDIELRDSTWRAMVTAGHLAGVELAELTGDSEAAISGRGEVQLEQFIISQTGIEWIRGRALIESGQMTAGLFHALGKYLDVSLREMNEVQAYGFDRCEFEFDIRQPNLYLCCQMDDAHGPLAARSMPQWEQPLPLENIVAALASCSSNPLLRANENTTDNQLRTGPAPAQLPTTWLSKQALVWLPMGDPKWQAAQAELRLSALPPDSAAQ